MTTFSQLVTTVSDKIQDDSFGSTEIKRRINKAVSKIARGVRLPGWHDVTPPIPELLSITTIDTELSIGYTTLPSTFQRDLKLCVNSSGDQIFIYDSFAKFMARYPSLSNAGDSVEAVCAHGGKLYYQPIPSTAQTLTVHFYRKPVDMVGVDDTPDGIPEDIDEDLLVNFVCEDIFSEIEDGVEGRKVNTSYHLSKFYAEMENFVGIIGHDGDAQTYDDVSEYTDSY